jgi:predicted RNase H-like HicB family nuclease
MNKKAIADTALCRYNEEENYYVVESPLFDRVSGVAETEKEARQIFHELLDETYLAYLEGKLVGYDKRGRPAKGNVEFHAQIKPEVKIQILDKAKALGISQGEVIAYLAAAAEMRMDLEKRLKLLEEKMETRSQIATQPTATV